MSYESALSHMLKFEGGYANDPADRGGETFRGISRKNWPGWPGWALIDAAKARGLRSRAAIDAAFQDDANMSGLVGEFYRVNFWRPFERLEAPDRIQEKLFDTAVNVGVGGAVKMLQRTVNRMDPIAKLTVDGQIGPRTVAAFAFALDPAGAENRFLTIFGQEQEAHYRRIVDRNPGQKKFLNGWLNRAAWVPK